MPKRLLTLFLLFALLIPASLSASGLHRCRTMGDSMMEGAGHSSCCGTTARAVSEDNSTTRLSHRCETGSSATEKQPATAVYKIQQEISGPADFVAPFVFSRQLPELTSRYTAGVIHLLSSGNRPPVFLRNCSFLI